VGVEEAFGAGIEGVEQLDAELVEGPLGDLVEPGCHPDDPYHLVEYHRPLQRRREQRVLHGVLARGELPVTLVRGHIDSFMTVERAAETITALHGIGPHRNPVG
jgi:hypothetical protein